METILIAPDIECDGCANSIKKALGRLDGVESVSVEVPTKIVTITHNAEVTEATLMAALDRAGFPATSPTRTDHRIDPL